MPDPFDLHRFLAAQDNGDTHERAMAELRAGRKVSHWMWFEFPQIAGLGQSPTSRRYAISGIAEARAYLSHPVLGSRLREGVEILLASERPDADAIFGGIDAAKLRSSMTLFARAGRTGEPFTAVLDRFFGGEPDALTERLIAAGT